MNRKQTVFTIFTKDSHKISQKTSCSLSSSWKDSGCRILFGPKHTVRHNLSDVEGESKGKEKWVQRTMWFCLGASRVGLRERHLCQEHCSNLIPLHSLQGRGGSENTPQIISSTKRPWTYFTWRRRFNHETCYALVSSINFYDIGN